MLSHRGHSSLPKRLRRAGRVHRGIKSRISHRFHAEGSGFRKLSFGIPILRDRLTQIFLDTDFQTGLTGYNFCFLTTDFTDLHGFVSARVYSTRPILQTRFVRLAGVSSTADFVGLRINSRLAESSPLFVAKQLRRINRWLPVTGRRQIESGKAGAAAESI